jgi:hypothetical protein
VQPVLPAQGLTTPIDKRIAASFAPLHPELVHRVIHGSCGKLRGGKLRTRATATSLARFR